MQDNSILTLPPSSVPVEINVSVSLDQVRISRSAFSMLDFLGDIGGLFGALNAIFGGIVIALQFNGLH